MTFGIFRGARQAEGRQPRSRRLPTGSDQSHADRRPRGAPKGSPLKWENKYENFWPWKDVLWTFLVLLKKLKKIHTVWHKPRNVKVQKCDIVTFGNVTKCHKMSHFFKSLVQSYVYLLCLDLALNDSQGAAKEISCKLWKPLSIRLGVLVPLEGTTNQKPEKLSFRDVWKPLRAENGGLWIRFSYVFKKGNVIIKVKHHREVFIETPKFVVLCFHTSRNESPSKGTRSPNLVLRCFHN